VLRGIPAIALWWLFGAHVIGCGTDDVTRPTASQEPGPRPDSPANVLRTLEWAFNHRALEPYRRILAADFRFYCSPIDSAGEPWRGTPWTREDEVIFATHLFVGGGVVEPDTSIQMTLDRNFLVYPDPWYPSDSTGRWHKNVRSTLTLLADGGAIEITGHANFYMVRGDSASIPEELGVSPDSTVWYLRRWDDETGESPTLRALPASMFTVCGLKVLYRQLPPRTDGTAAGRER
jgi:hypothetical protein